MKICLNTKLIDLNGEMVKNNEEELTLGKALGLIIAHQEVTKAKREDTRAFDRMKAYILSMECYTKDEISIDLADYKKIFECVEKTLVFESEIVVGQVLYLLEKEKNSRKNEVNKKGVSPVPTPAKD